MGESNELTFRNAGLGGFNKKDVIAYLEKLTLQFRQAEASYKQTNSALEKEALSLRDTVDSLQKELSEARSGLSRQNELIDEIETLKHENQLLSESCDALSHDKEQLIASLSLIKEELALRDKSLASINREKQAIADLEIAAKLRAQQTEKESREQISLMVNCCQLGFDDAAEAFDRFKVTASEMIRTTREQLESIDSLFSDVNERLSQSRSTISDLAGKFTGESSEE